MSTNVAPALVMSLVLAVCAVASAQEEGTVEIEAGTHVTPDGTKVPYDIGTLLVRENRSKADSRVIGVGFVRLPAAKQPAPAPPIFILPGGPGGSYTTSDRLPRMLAMCLRYRPYADVVLVDQRGFSERGDRLMATRPVPSIRSDRPYSLEDVMEDGREYARRAVAEYAGKGVDLAGYTVKECAHDVEQLRKALGYRKITLQGTSFGSQWSFAVMRLHPGSVARALLSGVEPLDHGYDMPSYVFAAIQRMWRVVDADERFAPYLPKGGMAEAARVAIERLEREPLRFETDDGDTGGKKLVGVMGPDDFPWHSPDQILELYHGVTRRWRAQAVARHAFFKNAKGRPSRILGPLIDTSLGVTPERRHRLWTDPAVRYLSRRGFASYLASADIWPSPDVGDDFRTPVLCDIPVVFAQGDWDLKTPLENTFEIAPYFVNSRVIVAERGGHGVIGPLWSQHPEVGKAFETFLRTGDMSGLPARVRVKPSRSFSPPRFDPPEK